MEEENGWLKNLTWWNKITVNTMALALAQSEAYLKETVATAQTIQDRTDKLIGIIIPIFTAIAAYVLGSLNKINDVLHMIALLVLIVLIAALFFLQKNIRKYSIHVPGGFADQLLSNRTVISQNVGDEQYLQIALNVCDTNKSRAQENDKINEKRSARNQISILILIIGLISSPILGVLIHLLSVNCF